MVLHRKGEGPYCLFLYESGVDLFVANATKFSLKDSWCVYTTAESDKKGGIQTTDILQKSPQELGNVHNKNAYTCYSFVVTQTQSCSFTDQFTHYVVAIQLQNMIK